MRHGIDVALTGAKALGQGRLAEVRSTRALE